MNKYYLIDHKILFFFGYVFYLFTPWVVGNLGSFAGYPGMDLFHGFYKRIPPSQLFSYIMITISWLPAFYLGHFTFKIIKPYKKSLVIFPSNFLTNNMRYVALFLIGVLFIFTYISRNSLVTSYDFYDPSSRGKISTLLIIFNFFLIYQLLSNQKLSVTLAIGTACTAVLLLIMGGRMYVMQTFVVILVYKTSFAVNRWKLYQIFMVVFACFIVGSFVGVARMNTSFNFSKAQYSLLAEPVFTWFSTSTFLINNDIPLINFPSNFLSSFLNLVPNTVINFKQFVVSSQSMGFYYVNPLGADSVWSTLIINFGSLGSFFFIYLTGFLLNFLRHLTEDNHFAAVYYIAICGMLPFQIFRDGFYIVNKQLFFNFLLFPLIIIFTVRLIRYYTENKPKADL